MGKRAYKAEEFLAAIENSGGFISTIARRVGCERSTVYAAMKKYASVRQAIEDEKEVLKDMSEGELLKLIKSGNVTAVIFYLKTQAKDRGYIERQEWQHTWKEAAAQSGVDPDKATAVFEADVNAAIEQLFKGEDASRD